MRIFHIATADDWAAAQAAGRYTTSTYGVSLADEGFIHASRADQWPGVRERFYADVDEPLVLLSIDRDQVSVPVVDEPVGGDTFPHIMGPLNLDAVVQAIPLDERSVAAPDAAVPAGAAPAGAAPAEANLRQDFGTLFLREMFRNVLVLVVLLANAIGGAVIGGAVGSGWGALVGLALGLLVGVPLAVLVYRQGETGSDVADG